MANTPVALDGTGKALALVSMLLVGAVVGVALLQYHPNVEESAITMPAMKMMPTASSQLRFTMPLKTGLLKGTVEPSLTQTNPEIFSGKAQNSMMSSLNPVAWLSKPRFTGAAASKSSHVVRAGSGPVTEDEVIAVQTLWADSIKAISKVYAEKGDYVARAAQAAGELYAYGTFPVLFKPTKAAEYQFRPTPEEAMSYFVGGKAVDNGYAEDGGFAINGGRGWSEVIYDNHQVVIKGDIGIAMGNYFFTDATDGSKSKVEYTFGYTPCDDGKVRIFLHHSSVPYSR